ncbi:hypothetical protein F8M41_013177 [Gigaspora margarita]|uniref:Uncharacterized protein n=1 Tax=Gigaspora margarita TaxID=4874 RepID=A0A8H4A0I8_GIGMA|nr:hypothetical protein F8M41_013177 [Gigaspora margarita]
MKILQKPHKKVQQIVSITIVPKERKLKANLRKKLVLVQGKKKAKKKLIYKFLVQNPQESSSKRHEEIPQESSPKTLRKIHKKILQNPYKKVQQIVSTNDGTKGTKA